MDKNLILSYICRSEYYTQLLGNYAVPRFVFSGTGRRLDLVKHREQQLAKLSSYAGSFKYDLEILSGKAGPKMKPWYNAILEFPVPIEDKELWKKCLDLSGAEVDVEMEKSFFALDFLLPLPGLVVEIDSGYHQGREKYDKARDTYLLGKYGIETVRYYEYGKSPDQRKLDCDNFRKTISWLWKRKTKLELTLPIVLDFSETGLANFFKYHKSGILFIDAIRRYIGESRWILERNIRIPKTELSRVDPKTFKAVREYKKGDLEMLFLGDVTELMLGVYGKILTIVE